MKNKQSLFSKMISLITYQKKERPKTFVLPEIHEGQSTNAEDSKAKDAKEKEQTKGERNDNKEKKWGDRKSVV